MKVTIAHDGQDEIMVMGECAKLLKMPMGKAGDCIYR